MCGFARFLTADGGMDCRAALAMTGREHDGVNGFLAETPEQLEQALQMVLADAGLHQRMGRAGRLKVERHYDIQAIAPTFSRLLFDAATQ